MQVQAEKAAWEMSKQHGFELVVINPTFVFGPVLSSRLDATSVLMFKVSFIVADANDHHLSMVHV